MMMSLNVTTHKRRESPNEAFKNEKKKTYI